MNGKQEQIKNQKPAQNANDMIGMRKNKNI